MNLKNTFGFLLFLLIPGTIEYLIEMHQCGGNMGLTGACLDIYYKRNLLYGLASLVISSVWFGFCKFVTGVVIIFVMTIVFIQSSMKWVKFLISSKTNECVQELIS